MLDVDADKKLVNVSSHMTYQEDEMTLVADSAQMHYREDESGLHPERLELQGHIKIFSQDRRGIADTLTYNPDTRQAILKAVPGQKVLFSRDQDQLRISANELQITYNPVYQAARGARDWQYHTLSDTRRTKTY
jgi:lipopolysaccharide export system protein LptA